MTRVPVRPFVAATAVLCCLLAGCGGGRPLGEVDGVVRKNGQPLAGVAVAFHPDPAEGIEPIWSSTAVTDQAGRFVLQYPDPSGYRTGAVIGRHKVTLKDVAWYDDRDNALKAPPRTSTKYEGTGSTTLTAEVRPGSQTIDFDVK